MQLFTFAMCKVSAPIAKWNISNGKLLDLYGILTKLKARLFLLSKRPKVNFPFSSLFSWIQNYSDIPQGYLNFHFELYLFRTKFLKHFFNIVSIIYHIHVIHESKVSINLKLHNFLAFLKSMFFEEFIHLLSWKYKTGWQTLVSSHTP